MCASRRRLRGHAHAAGVDVRDVYRNPEAKKEEEKAKKMLISLYTYYQEHPEQMSREYRNLIGCSEDKTQVVCDYIAGMTDQYSMHKYEELFVPKAWAVY